MQFPQEEKWLQISDRYEELWNMPNCVGSIDGKHVRIRKPNNSGSSYRNYKHFLSVVLLACADADGLFAMISVGDLGRNSEGAVLKTSPMYKVVNEGTNFPPPRPLPTEEDKPYFPFYFVADEAFPLSRHVTRLFPERTLIKERRVFNCRLSGARKSVECGLGSYVQNLKFWTQQSTVILKLRITLLSVFVFFITLSESKKEN
jgi:hypothetical protein